jgi:hypothetical protein
LRDAEALEAWEELKRTTLKTPRHFR